jgi:hypothetical protein
VNERSLDDAANQAPFHSIAGAPPERLAGLLLSPARMTADALIWTNADLASILRHQLASPLTCDLGRVAPEAVLTSLLSSVPGPLSSFADLLAHPAPPLEMLRLAKDFAKGADASVDAPLPEPVASLLYYAAIAGAMLRHSARISSLDAASLRRAVEWTRRQVWVDEQLRQVIVAGLSAQCPATT